MVDNEGRKPTLLHCGLSGYANRLDLRVNEGRKPTLLHCGGQVLRLNNNHLRERGSETDPPSLRLLCTPVEHIPRRQRGSETDPPSLRQLSPQLSPHWHR